MRVGCARRSAQFGPGSGCNAAAVESVARGAPATILTPLPGWVLTLNSPESSAPSPGCDVSVVIPVCNEQDNVLAARPGDPRALAGATLPRPSSSTTAATTATHSSPRRTRGRHARIRLVRTPSFRGSAPWRPRARCARALDRHARRPTARTTRRHPEAARGRGAAPRRATEAGGDGQPHGRAGLPGCDGCPPASPNGVRGGLLRDGTTGHGCGIKVFDRAVSHGTLPASTTCTDSCRRCTSARLRSGFVPVNHGTHAWQVKYGLHNRLWVASWILFGGDVASSASLGRRASDRRGSLD